jgi:beta-galactosidase
MTGRALSRRSALAGLTAGAAAVAGGICAKDLLGGSGPRPVAAMLDDLVGSYDFNQGWLFGGPYVKGAELPRHDDSGYARVTLPHTVTDLSWTGWDYRTWERTWIYRKHFDSAFAVGTRVLVTFDGVMTNATVVLNGRVVATHAGGYLPWTAELTGHLRPRGNVLAVIVDGRWLGVPPDALPGGPPTMDFLQPAGIYRDVRLEVVPDIYLEDVFVLPRDVLAAGRTVRVTASVQAGAVPRDGAVAVTAALLDGDRTLATARTTLTIGRPARTRPAPGPGSARPSSARTASTSTAAVTRSSASTGTRCSLTSAWRPRPGSSAGTRRSSRTSSTSTWSAARTTRSRRTSWTPVTSWASWSRRNRLAGGS